MRSILIILLAAFVFAIWVNQYSIEPPKSSKLTVTGSSREEFQNIEAIRGLFRDAFDRKLYSYMDVYFSERYSRTDLEDLKRKIREAQFPFDRTPIKLDYIKASGNRVYVSWLVTNKQSTKNEDLTPYRYVTAVFYLEDGKIVECSFYSHEI